MLGAALKRVLDEPAFRSAARKLASESATLPTIDGAVDELLRLAL